MNIKNKFMQQLSISWLACKATKPRLSFSSNILNYFVKQKLLLFKSIQIFNNYFLCNESLNAFNCLRSCLAIRCPELENVDFQETELHVATLVGHTNEHHIAENQRFIAMTGE